MATKTIRVTMELSEQIEELGKLMGDVLGTIPTISSLTTGLIMQGSPHFLSILGLVLNNSFEDDGITPKEYPISYMNRYIKLKAYFNDDLSVLEELENE